MTRRYVALVRAALLVIAVVLIGVGAAVAAWSWRLLGDPPWVPDRLDSSAVTSWTEQPWWPWALGAAAVVVLAAGTWLLIGAVPPRRPSTLELPGSSPAGRLSVDASAFARHAADAVATAVDASSASGHLERDKNRTFVDLEVRVGPAVDLAEARDAAQSAMADLRRTLGRDDVGMRTRYLPARKARARRHLQ